MEPYQIALVVVGGIVLLYTILAFFAGRFFLKQAFRPVAYTLEEVKTKQTTVDNVDYSDYDNVWNKQPFEIDGTQGKLRGEYIVNPQATSTPAKVAIVVHGHTQNRLITIKYATIFYNLGYNLVIYDHPYFGLSDGEFTTVGGLEARDLTLVVDFARQTFGKDSFIALHGESMGAVTVLRVLALRSDINLVVADCPYSHAMKFFREKCRQVVPVPSFPIVDFANLISTIKYKCNFNKVDNVKVVQGTQVPICFIHGTADPLIYYYHSQKLYQAAQNPLSELHLFEGALHARCHLFDPVRYTQIVSDFVTKIENNTTNN